MRYLRQFKIANAVGKSAKKISVITVMKSQSFIELFAGRKLKYVPSPADAEEVEINSHGGDARILPNVLAWKILLSPP